MEKNMPTSYHRRVFALEPTGARLIEHAGRREQGEA